MVHTTEIKKVSNGSLQYINRSTEVASEKVKKNFTQLCSQIIDDIDKNRYITAESIERFSRFTTFLLSNNIIFESDAFEKLSKKLKEYWHYELVSEKDPQRGCSYIQIYQMITIVHQKNDNIKTEQIAHDEKGNQLQNKEIIKTIKESPGITFKDIRNSLQLPSGSLGKKLKELEEQHFIVGRRTGEYRYYILTSLGNILYQNLCDDTYNIWVDRWSYERLIVLFTYIISLQKNKASILIQEAVNHISLWSDSEILHVFRNITTKYNRIIQEFKYLQNINFIMHTYNIENKGVGITAPKEKQIQKLYKGGKLYV